MTGVIDATIGVSAVDKAGRLHPWGQTPPHGALDEHHHRDSRRSGDQVERGQRPASATASGLRDEYLRG